MATDGTSNRSISLQVYLPGEKGDKEREAKYRAIVNSIRQYRSMARYCYGIMFNAYAAGASFDMKNDNFRVIPHNDRAKEIMALALGKRKEDGSLYKATAYEVRDLIMEINPTWISFVFDSMRAEVASKWNAPDTEHPKAKRGFLTLQGERGIAKFSNVGIGMPRATAKPRLEGHSIFLKWDREIGEVEFRHEQLDSGRYYPWKQVRDGAWQLGTVYLKEHDGRLRILLTYSRPKVLSDLDPTRELKVVFSDELESAMRMVGPDGEASYDSVSASAAIAGIDELKKISEYYEARRKASGNPRKPWGFGKAYVDSRDTQNRVTQRRELQQSDWNHRWSRRIIENAKRWRCGRVVMVDRPAGVLAGRPWQWSQLKDFVKYKIDEIGGKFAEISERE